MINTNYYIISLDKLEKIQDSKLLVSTDIKKLRKLGENYIVKSKVKISAYQDLKGYKSYAHEEILQQLNK